MAPYLYTFSSNTTDFTTNFSDPIYLRGKKYEVVLVRLKTFNSIPKI